MAPKSPQRSKSSNQGSPQPRATENDKDKEEKNRKRVCKACDRCRLKKSKCDGEAPCNRCQADNGVCLYGQRKKTVDKVYPKGFTDQLVSDYTMLCKAVQMLYSYHHSDHKGEWDFPDVEKRGSNGTFLLHDILKTIDLLEPPVDGSDDSGYITEDPMQLCQTFEKKEEFERRVAEAVEEVRIKTPSVSEFPMVDPIGTPMSRSSSFGSSQHGTPFSHFKTLPSRHMPMYGYQPTPQPQYGLSTPSGGMMPPTPTESPSEEGFPLNPLSMPHQHSEMNQIRGAFARYMPTVGAAAVDTTTYRPTPPNVDAWVHHQSQTQQFKRRRTEPSASANVNQGRVPSTLTIPTQAPSSSLMMHIPSSSTLHATTVGGAETSFAQRLDEAMLATATSGTSGSGARFEDEQLSPWSALREGNDPDMGLNWEGEGLGGFC